MQITVATQAIHCHSPVQITATLPAIAIARRCVGDREQRLAIVVTGWDGLAHELTRGSLYHNGELIEILGGPLDHLESFQGHHCRTVLKCECALF